MEQNSFQTIVKDDKGKTNFHHLWSLIAKPSKKVIPILAALNIGNSRDSYGNTLLHIAAEYQNIGIIQYLLVSGSQIDVQNNDGKTALIIALEKRNRGSAEILLEANANLFISDNSGKNALNWYFEVHCCKRPRLEMVLLKVKSQCLGNSEVIANKLFAAGCPLYSALLLENFEVAKMMLNLGCEVDAREPYSEPISGRTALHVAVMWLGIKYVKLLLDNNADPSIEDEHHRTPLYIVQDLLKNGKLEDEQVEMVKLLIDRGAALVTTDGTSSWSQVNHLLSIGSREVIEILLQANLAQHLNNKRGNNFLLHNLVSNYNPDVFETFVGHVKGLTFDVDYIDSHNISGETPLWIAGFHGNLVAIEFLLDRGADVNAVTINGYSSLYRCVDYCSRFQTQRKACQLLLEHGADVALRVNTGLPTVFDLVEANEARTPVGELLLAHVALQTALEVHIDEFIYQKIHAHPTFDDYYNFCTTQLVVEMYRSVTLLDLLKMGDSEFERYARNQELAPIIERFNDKWKTKLDYFNTILQKRYSKAVQLLKLRKEAACHFCQIIKTDYYRHPLITDKIVSYLDEKDLQNLLLVPL